MSLKARAILVVVIGTILGVSLSVGGRLVADKHRPAVRELTWEQARMLVEVMERVKRDYVEPIDDTALIEKAIRGMVDDLDRHSEILDAPEYQKIRISTSGRYSGVGLEISELDNRILVIAPIDGTPAQRAGLEAGDEIIGIDGQTVLEDGLKETKDRLRGPAGSLVAIRVKRESFDDPLDFHLTRQKIRVISVRHEMLDPTIGYLRLSQFNHTTPNEARQAVATLIDEAVESDGNGLAGLILDLRNNPGGILDSAVDVSDLFLEEGVIVSVRGRTPESRFTRVARSGDILEGVAIVVLVNAGSASASEIVAGALQDHDRATVLGTQTFGKGLVQTVTPLSRGRAIKLTTSRYFTPSGDSIDQTGISPDVVVRSARGFPDQDLKSRIDRENDDQLLEALALIREKPMMHTCALGDTETP